MRPPDLPDLPIVYLRSEQVYAGRKPVIVTTILGSCVSATMFCEKKRMGAICHALLPDCPKGRCTNCRSRPKYVSCVIPEMVSWFKKQDVFPDEIEVKIFGGADIFTNGKVIPQVHTIGRQNVAAAKKAIAENHLKLSAGDVGGEYGRKLFFFTNTGKILVKYLKK